MTEIQLQDICRAMDTPSSRISEALAGLGATPGNRGRRPATVNLSDAIRAGVVRGLILLGLSANAALDITRQVSRDDIKAVVHRDESTWLGVRNDPERPGAYLFVLCSPDEMKDIAATGCGGLRFLDVHSIAKAIIGETLKRKQLTRSAKGASVTQYQANNPNMHGAVVEDLGQEIGLAVVKYGKGQRLRMSAAEAKLLAEKLLSMAAEREAPAPENLN